MRRFIPLLLVVAAVTDCARPPAARLVVAPSCPAGRVLPRCGVTAGAKSVREYAASPLPVGSPVRLVGRLVPGARCCWEGCSRPCVLQLGLVDETESSLTPSSGPLVLLTTADAQGSGFTTPLVAKHPTTCAARFEDDARRAGDYCCDLEVSGQRVMVTGRVVSAPSPGKPFECPTPGPQDAPPVAPMCLLSTPWRNDERGALAIALDATDGWCQIPDENTRATEQYY